jgi:hypothetical protein
MGKFSGLVADGSSAGALGAKASNNGPGGPKLHAAGGFLAVRRGIHRLMGNITAQTAEAMI